MLRDTRFSQLLVYISRVHKLFTIFLLTLVLNYGTIYISEKEEIHMFLVFGYHRNRPYYPELQAITRTPEEAVDFMENNATMCGASLHTYLTCWYGVHNDYTEQKQKILTIHKYSAEAWRKELAQMGIYEIE